MEITKRNLRCLLFFMGLITCLVLAMALDTQKAYADTTTLTVKVTSDSLNVRSGPGTSYSILGKLSKGASVNVLASQTVNSTVWYKITYNSKTAYIAASHTSKFKLTKSYDPLRSGKTTGSLTVRSGPGTSYTKVGSLASGKTVTLRGYVYRYTLSSYKGWYRITYNNKTAYISADYVKLLSTTIKYNPAYIGEITKSTGFRTGAGTSYTSIMTLAAGTRVTIDALVTAYSGETASKWYKTIINGKTGYVSASATKLLERVDTADFEQYLTDQGFPESYKNSLKALHEAHPKWIFKAQHTGIDWAYTLQKEQKTGISLLAASVPDAWKSFEEGAYNFTTNTWVKFDGSWLAADGTVVAYYLDPRNFLTEKYIYQFLDHQFDSASQSPATVRTVAKGTFLDTDYYGTTIYEAGAGAGVNPNVITSMIRQEQGSAGTSSSISGTYPGYVGYYNYFNIGAYATDTMTAVERGLWFAKGSGVGSTTYGRPWNTRTKSINGGAMYYAGNYVKMNQYTFYLKKFNVMNGADKVATHQYMTHVLAAASEGASLGTAYAPVSDYPLVFHIPVYSNMPAAPSPAPVSTGNNDNLLDNVYITGTNGDVPYNLIKPDGTAGFARYTGTYTITIPSTSSQIVINPVAHNNTSYVSAAYVTLDGPDASLPDNFNNTGKTTRTTLVTADLLDVRSGPGLSFGILGTTAKNTGFTVTGTVYADGITWYKVSYSGKTGYLDSNGTNKLTTTRYYALQQSGTTTDNLNVRKTPSASGTLLGTLSTGSRIAAVGEVTNPDGSRWYITSYKGTSVSGGGIVTLAEGSNTIRVTVTSTSGKTRTYTITVNR